MPIRLYSEGYRFDVVVLAACLALSSTPSYWDTPRAGANGFNAVPTEAWFAEAKENGIGLVRLTFSKWKGQGRDFLIGDTDRFTKLVPEDLAVLRRTLGWAHKHGVRVVLTPLTLPGCRWRQQNGDRPDPQMWTDPAARKGATEFWRQLAGAVKDSPALVGYDILNEPAPEAALKIGDDSAAGLAKFAAEHEGGAADVNVFNREIWTAIRQVDKKTPVIVEPIAYGSPDAMASLLPLPDPNVLYSFHAYGPWELVSWRANKGRYGSPSPFPPGANPDWLTRQFAAVDAWAKRYRIPGRRIFVGELGCDRRVVGCDLILRDTLREVERRRWHWAFYSFREDEWDGMDYEMGSEPGSGGVSRAEARAARRGNAMWKVLSDALGRRR